jgi:ribosomal protein S6--L-glutamate ligase
LPRYDAVIPWIDSTEASVVVAVLRNFERQGISCTNPSKAVETASDMLRILQAWDENGIEMPWTVVAGSGNEVISAVRRIVGTPVLIRQLGANRRDCTIRVDSREALVATDEFFKQCKKEFLVQKLEPENRGFVIRAIVVGDRVIAAVRNEVPLRHPGRAFGKSGVIERVMLDRAVEAAIVRAAHALGLCIAGIDFLECHAGPRVLSATHSPDLQSVEQCTEVNIVGRVIDCVASSVRDIIVTDRSGLPSEARPVEGRTIP